MKRILIIPTRELPKKEEQGFCFIRNHKMRELHQANIVILKTRTHFRCIKNRWEETASDEKIPNKFLVPYLMEYEVHMEKQELIECIVSLTRTEVEPFWGRCPIT